jgi:uncharacterized RDD family membrane protein YckC
MRNIPSRFLIKLAAILAGLAVLLLPAPQAPAAAGAPSLALAPPALRQRDVLAAAGEDHFWICRVAREPQDNTAQSTIVFRPRVSNNNDWTALPPVPDRVASIAASDGELLIVLANGQWEIANDNDLRSGPTDASWDSMQAIAADGDTVWAVVRGSLPATQPGTPSTRPSTQAAAEISQPAAPENPQAHSGEMRLMICQFQGGAWSRPVPVPAGVIDDPAAISLAVIKGLPMLAWRTAGGINVSHMSTDGKWSAAALVAAPREPVDFKLLSINQSINQRGLLWIALPQPTTRPASNGASGSSSATAGDVIVENDWQHRITLTVPGKLPPNITCQTLVDAFGNLRWIALAGDQQLEQDYSLDKFPQSFEPARQSAVPGPRPTVIPLVPWIGGYSALLAITGILAIRQKSLPPPKPPQTDARPRLAPLGVRFVAGLVDLAPMLAVVAILHPASAANALASIDAKSLADLSWLSLATYILHTLLAEMICGQSLGKMIFTLRVVGADGRPPKLTAIILRNLLRIIDVTLILPLLIVFLTPLQQRVGDIVGGTVVIVEAEESDNGDGEEPDGN